MTTATCPTPQKWRYLSQEAALATVRELKQSKGKNRENKKLANKLGAYRCPCGYFHVGHNKYKRVKM